MTTKEKIDIFYKNLKLEEIIEYFDLPIDEITYESIREDLLKNLDIQNYCSSLNIILFCGLGGMEHINSEKSLKFIEILLQNGFNTNYCNNYFNGDNLIQFAIEKGCSTEFVVKLINLAKKYKLNVNAKNMSGDSIIHTAISSRNYLGEILPIMEALGPNFDFNCKDKNRKDIIVRFNMCKSEVEKEIEDVEYWIGYYKNEENSKEMFLEETKEEEAKLNYISSYYKRLIREENFFRKAINVLRNSIDVLPKTMRRQKQRSSISTSDKSVAKQNMVSEHRDFDKSLFLKINDISSKLTFDFIIQNRETLAKLKDKLITLGNDETLSSDDKKVVSTKLETFNKLIQETVTKEVERVKMSNDMSYLSDLEKKLQENGFQTQQQTLEKVIDDYQTKVKWLANSIKYNLTLKNSSEIEEMLNTLDSENKKNLTKDFQARKKKLLEVVDRFEKLQLLSVTFSIAELPKKVYSEYNLAKLNEIITKMKKEISNKKVQISSNKYSLSKNLKLSKNKPVRRRSFPLIEPVVQTEKLARGEFLEQQAIIQNAQKIYYAKIGKLKENIENNLTLNNIDEFRKIITVLDDASREELSKIFEVKKGELLSLIKKMKATPSYGMEKLPVELYSEYNLTILKKIEKETKKDRFIGDTMINIRLQSEFDNILTPESLKLLEQDDFQREISIGENQSFSNQKVKKRKKAKK